MRLAKKHITQVPPVDMTPMIDVVMLLLIFFMTVTQLSEAVDLPPEKGTKGQQASTVVISIFSSGKLRAEVRRMVGGVEQSEEQEVNQAVLGSVLDYRIEQADYNPDLVRVLIRADQLAPSGSVSDVVTLLREKGIKGVRFAVRTD